MSEMDTYRLEMDRIDAEILKLFEERMETAKKIGSYKASRGMPVLDARREQEKIDALRAASSSPDLADGAEQLFRLLMALSRKAQQELLSGQTSPD